MSARGGLSSRSAEQASLAGRASDSATDSASAGHYSYVSDSAPEKPPSTFTSSLSIAVEGSSSVEKGGMDVGNALALPQPTGEVISTRRTPRKSKMDALAALNRSRSPSIELVHPSSTKRETPSSVLNGTPISVGSTLDMSTVKTEAPRNIPPRTNPRPFGLEYCPIFYPSPDEFKDPMGYIRSISPHGQQHGLVKIVPPIGWKMPFVIDTEVGPHHPSPGSSFTHEFFLSVVPLQDTCDAT